MFIGLIDIEPKVFNTAYMQIASYHRAKHGVIEHIKEIKPTLPEGGK